MPCPLKVSVCTNVSINESVLPLNILAFYNKWSIVMSFASIKQFQTKNQKQHKCHYLYYCCIPTKNSYRNAWKAYYNINLFTTGE